MLRVAIVGCGKIADQHVAAIQRTPDSEIVAVCDREPLMAQQLAERFGIKHCFSDASQMFAECPLDVVHITTPPQGHFPLARQSLDLGIHVYLEKPFTVAAKEAKVLTDTAEKLGLKITAGHNLQFTLEMQEMRRLIANGYLGGHPVHLESHFSYDLGGPSYIGPVLNNPNHWVRQLPGQLFHNIISHGVARLTEFLDDELVEVFASAHQSQRLAKAGGGSVLDELRVFIRDKKGTTAFFCFSTQIRPGLSQFRICGPRNSITVDQSSGSVIRQSSGLTKSYLTYLLPPLRSAWEHIRNARRNVADFLSRRLYQDAGMSELIAQFYQSIRTGGTPPIPYREIVLTARIMDDIFAQISSKRRIEHSERDFISA